MAIIDAALLFLILTFGPDLLKLVLIVTVLTNQ